MSNKVLSKLNLNAGSLSVPSINYKNMASGDSYPVFYQNTNNMSAWTAATPSGAGWRGVCWSKELSLFCAVSFTSGTTNIATSPTGATWTTQTGPNTQTLTDVIWISQLGLFVACANTGVSGFRIITSANGTGWTARATPANNQWFRLAWSPELGIIVCVSADGTNRFMTSYDAITWNLRTSPTQTTQVDWRGLVWAPELSLFVATGIGGSPNKVATSPDGIVWSYQTSTEASEFLSMCWSPELNLLVAVGFVGTNRIYTSSNATSWTAISAPEANSWHKVVWAAELGLFVAVAESGGTGRLMISSNGTSWVASSTAISSGNAWGGLCWSKELSTFVAVAGSGTNLAAYSINKNNLVHSNSATSNIYSSGFLTLDNSYTLTTNRLITKKMVSQSLRLHDTTVSTGQSNSGALVITGGIGLGGGSTTPSRITFGGSYTVADPGSSKLLVLFNDNAYTDNHRYYGFGINSGTLRYHVDNIAADHIFYAATGSDTSQELFRVCGNQTIQIQNGTVAIPSLSFQTDTTNDTGIYRIAEDSMGITTGGKLHTQTTFAQPALPFTDANLLLYYSFRNSLLTDTSANGYTLTNNNVVTTTDVTDSTNGVTLYNCATFNGTTQYLSRNTTSDTALRSAFNSTAGISISLWIYNTNVAVVSAAILFTDAALNASVTTSNQRYQIFVESNSVTLHGDTGVAADYIQPKFTISSSQWYHVVFTHGPSGILLYINGVLTTPTSFVSGSSSTPYQVLNNITSMYIGIYGNIVPWPGSIKHVMVSSSIWTADQAQQIYNSQLGDVMQGTNSMYAFTTDLKTGLLRQKNNTMALTSDAKTKMLITSTGCVINYKTEVVSTQTYQLDSNNYQVEFSFAGNITATLPLSSQHLGREYILIKISSTASGTVIINVSGSDVINGSLTSLTLTNQYDRTHLTSNGTGGWYTI